MTKFIQVFDRVNEKNVYVNPEHIAIISPRGTSVDIHFSNGSKLTTEEDINKLRNRLED